MANIEKIKKLWAGISKYEKMVVTLRQLFMEDDGKINDKEATRLKEVSSYIEKIKARLDDILKKNGETITDTTSDTMTDTTSDTTTTVDPATDTTDKPITSSSIKASVGKDGTNDDPDVRLVQELLKITVDGQVGSQTIGAIEAVQRSIFNGWSDGLVEPGEKTWQHISGGGSISTDNAISPNTETGEYKNTTGKLLFEDKARAKHGDQFIIKLKEICSKLGLEPDFLMATIDAECGFDHKAVNKYTQASGLIQFMPFTAKDLGTTIQDIQKMSALKQLDYVYKYFSIYKKLVNKLSEPAESYLIVFYPYAVGKPNDYVLGSQVGPGTVAAIARQNAIYDLNKDGKVTKGEIMEYMRKNKYKDAYAMMEQLSQTKDDGNDTNADPSDTSTTDTDTSNSDQSDPETQVAQGGEPSTANFKLSEFLSPNDPQRYIPNELWPNIAKLMKQLEVIRSALGVPLRISSGYRSPIHNANVGGVSNSQHLKGIAADIVCSVHPHEVHATISRLIDEGKIVQGGLGKYNGFTHYDIRGTAARW
ncbi:MAG: D-Ala-D-Ala carboxypeptidase family metallohydrolase [Saprospiraceae bacterium]|nr:D-Ala-D-Ala carboxypeptidase family metallohydrolase [Saprospiraceae bacterium]